MIEFIWALGAIILIDVVLGGENALAIAGADDGNWLYNKNNKK